MKKIIKNLITLVILMSIFLTGVSYAGFADFDDATADKQGAEDLKKQEEDDAKNAGKSSNNYLSNLEIEGYSLTPQFDKQTINYSINEDINVSSVMIKAMAEDERATITGDGKVELQSGENNLKIDVKAENGTERTYFIRLNKKIEKGQPKLDELKINAIMSDGKSEEIEISPEFKKDTFEYKCEVYNETTSIKLNAIAENDSNVEITGNADLKEGNNVVTVKVQAESGEESVYKINVYRKEKQEQETVNTEENSSVKIIVPILVMVLVVIIIGIFAKKDKKRVNKH